MTPDEIVAFVQTRVGVHCKRWLRLSHHDREDLVQDLCIVALRAQSRYDPEQGATLKTYVERRVNGAVVDWLRAKTHHRKVTVPSPGRAHHPQAKKRQCKNKHLFTPTNTIIRRTRWGTLCRECRICRNRMNREWRARKKQHDASTATHQAVA